MVSTSSQPQRIVIIGGSLTGLMTAIPLLRLGHKVTILERTPSAKVADQGAGIASIPIVPPILAALRALSTNPTSISPVVDFFQEFDRTKTPFSCPDIDQLRWLSGKGEVKKEVSLRSAVGLKDGQTSTGGCSWDLLYTILRANFDGGLEGSYVAHVEKFDSDGEAEYWDGVNVTSIVDHGDKVEVYYEGGSIEAAFVIGADGSGSVVRKLLAPEVERKYVGYVAWRGTVLESELSMETRDLLCEHATSYHAKAMQVVLYCIPGQNGSVEDGKRLLNIVWYENYEDPSKILTDSDGVRHNLSLGVGKIDPATRINQLEKAARTLPASLNEVWSKVQSPFIQAITDSLAPRAVFMDGKVVLAGDAVAGFRPHTTAGTAQGGMHALLLKDVFEGRSTIEEWGEKVMGFARMASGVGIGLGTQSQFGKHPMADE